MKLELVNNSKLRIVFAVIATMLLVALVISACNINIGIGGEEIPSPGPGILAPPDQTDVLVGGPVQIESAHPGEDISRVELYVRGPDQAGERLIRADVPDPNGVVVQEWIPEEPGLYTIRTVAYTTDNTAQPSLTIQLEALDSAAVSVPLPGIEALPAEGAAVFQPPPATPTVVPAAPTPEVVVQVVIPTNLTPTPTPPLAYPPPPPLPGVPKGPTQDMLPLKIPPVCDAAELLGVFTADTGQRIFIPTDDQIAAKVVGGAVVHRAWRLRNIGTCTWGPGYELDLYGGRDMGSGGVAFDVIFPPGDPGRCNALVDPDRLICPEAEPNETAVLEVLLRAPSIPGIHQSYWRMRNPQGVWFGPIIGVTFEVVRDCTPEPGGPIIYGAPIINRFEVLGVGDVFEPETPTNVIANFGDTVTLVWDVINAQSFDIVLRNPLGNISTLSNTTTQGRAQFIASELGTYVITIYAENGPCVFTDEVQVIVIPRDEDLFELDIILSPTTASVAAAGAQENVSVSSVLDLGDVRAEWRHIASDVDEFVLVAQLQRRVENQCEIFGLELPDWIPCETEGWNAVVSQSFPFTGTATVPAGEGLGVQGAARLDNLKTSLCRGRTPPEDYRIQFYMRALRNGRPYPDPDLALSNTVEVSCLDEVVVEPDGERLPVATLPVEIEENNGNPP